ncbi:MAG: MBG domain-containing protein [Deinococcota bacterium]
MLVTFMMSWAAAQGGTISTVAGTGTRGFSGDGDLATAAQLFNPTNVTIDSAGNLFIADFDNDRIRKVDTSGIISTVAGTTEGFSGDGGLATAAQLSLPTDVAVDSAGNLFIADRLNYRIRKVDTAGIITTVAGDGTEGFSGDGGLATAAQLNWPFGVTVDSAGNLFIADFDNDRIRKVDTSGIITTVAGDGTEGFGGDGGPATAAQLRNPIDVTVDSAGNLFIADQINHRIRKVDTAGIITTVAGTTRGFGGDGGLATAAQLNRPYSVTVDSAGNLFIADFGNNRIRKVIPVSDQTITFTALANRTYGDAIFTVNATASSGLDVSFSSATPTVCTTNGTDGEDITLVTTGTCTINANQAGDANFNAAPQVQQSFTVTPKALTATVDDQSRIFGAANPTFTITYTGFVGADIATDLDSLAIATTTADATTPAGTVLITCDVTSFTDTNYTLAAGDCAAGTLTIGTVALTITAEDVTFVSGDPVPMYTVTYNGFVGADDPSVLGGTLDITDDTGGDYTTLGVFTLTPSGLTSTNYAITFVPGTLTIVRNPITQAPDIQLRDGNSTAADSITSNGLVPLSYGSFKRNQTVILDYLVRNPGAKTLDLGELTLPSFMSVEGDALPERLASFESALLQVRVDTSIAGTLTGQVSLTSNDPDVNEKPFTFDVVITISNEPANAVYVLPGVDLADVTVRPNQQNVPIYSAKLQVPTGSVAVTLNALSLTADNLPALSSVQSLTLVIDGGTRGIRDSRDVVLATVDGPSTDTITFTFPERTLQPNLPLWLLVVADF